MKQPQEDRRAQRTRQLLHDAMFSLMLEKRYDKITVQDIIDRANVGRSTFYAHFQDKEDLALSGMVQMLDQLGQAVGQDASGGLSLMPVLALFQHVQENQHFFKALTRGRGLDLFFERGQVYWTRRLEAALQAQLPQGQLSSVPIPIIATSVSGALITLLKWWLDNKMPYTPERMDEIARQLTMPMIEAGLKDN